MAERQRAVPRRCQHDGRPVELTHIASAQVRPRAVAAPVRGLADPDTAGRQRAAQLPNQMAAVAPVARVRRRGRPARLPEAPGEVDVDDRGRDVGRRREPADDRGVRQGDDVRRATGDRQCRACDDVGLQDVAMQRLGPSARPLPPARRVVPAVERVVHHGQRVRLLGHPSCGVDVVPGPAPLRHREHGDVGPAADEHEGRLHGRLRPPVGEEVGLGRQDSQAAGGRPGVAHASLWPKMSIQPA